MKVTPIKTRRVENNGLALEDLIKESLFAMEENSILAVTSKVVSLCEGSALPGEKVQKDDLIKKEAELFLPKEQNRYGVFLTIKKGLLVPSAGVDESNGNGFLVPWPQDAQASANCLWQFLREHFGLKNAGVIITDSVVTPLRWGVTGRCIAYCGFHGLQDRNGRQDLFGRPFAMTHVAVADGCAAAAVLCMGETDEQTPLALLEELPFAEFAEEPPCIEELAARNISPEEDLFGPLLSAVSWEKGGK